MEKLYFFVTQTQTFQNDSTGVLQYCFVEQGNLFTLSFLIALGMAVLCAAVFYGWFGMASNKLSNLGVWLVSLVVSGVLTFVLTARYVIGYQFGILAATAMTNRTEEIGNNLEQLNLFQSSYTSLMSRMDGLCDVVLSLEIGNAIIAIVLFFLISLIVKRFTVHAISVPF